MKSVTSVGASAAMILGIVGIGLGFWKVRPGLVFIGAALILTGYSLGAIARWA